MKPKVIGIVPARMEASRFPGKPMHPILGRPMIEHVFERAKLYGHWDLLCVATCNKEIDDFAKFKKYPSIMTKNTHTRALDRVAEAATKCGLELQPHDIIVCVQGDEPMLEPEMIDACISPLLEKPDTAGTILSMEIHNYEQFINPDTVKVIHNAQGEVLYTSRSPVPYCKGEFSAAHGARRIYGIFGFRWQALKKFTETAETRLEKLESCDSNRILDMDFCQIIAPYPFKKSFSVDSPEDINLVEKYMSQDKYWGTY